MTDGDTEGAGGIGQTCTNTRNTSIPSGVFSFKVEFVNIFKLTEVIVLFLFWPYQILPLPVGERLDLISTLTTREY